MSLRTNYILIDYENIQPKVLSGLDAEHFKVMVFVGANQSKISFETAAALQALGEKAQYIQISGNGTNALDFHIAFYIGRLAAEEPTPYFHIISKDKGFDPLIEHLRSRKILAARSTDISDIPLLKIANSRSPAEKRVAIIEHLRTRGAAKPRTLKTLTNTILTLFQKQVPEEEVKALLRTLSDEGAVTVSGTKVAYKLPEA